MADTDAVKEAKRIYEVIPIESSGFFLRGPAHWIGGTKSRLARIFNQETARKMMQATDHGYFRGPTTGLERGFS
jgi:putative autoinducer-2 (AI-2) aldolase